MNRTTRGAVLTLAAALALIACGSSSKLPARPAPRPRVSWQPGDELTQLDQSLTVHVDRDMVGIEAVGPVLESPPVSMRPPLPLRVHWQDRRTLVIAPESGWSAGYHYEAVLDPQLFAGVEPAQQHFSFDAQPLRLSGLTLPKHNAERTPTFDAYFTLPVDPQRVAERCVLRSGEAQRTPLRLVPDTRPSTPERQRVRLAAAAELALQTRYRFDCPELRPSSGDAPFRADARVASFVTHGLLELLYTAPEAHSHEPPEHAELCLELSTPVEDEELARHVHVTPTPEGLEQAWYQGSCRPSAEDEGEDEDRESDEDESLEAAASPRKNSVLLAPRLHYRVTVDPELKDVFGQPLGRAASFEFDTADRIPGMWTVTGVGPVLERGRREHSVGTLNLSALQLSCAELTPGELARQFSPITSWVHQAGVRSADVDFALEPAPWQQLGLAPRTAALTATAPPNRALVLPLDLGASCSRGAGTERTGLYALELAVQEPAAASGKGAKPPEFQGSVPARLLANVTDLGVVAKRGATTGLAWVTRLSSGELVANATVELIDAQGQVMARASTDRQGLARFARLPAASQAELFAVRAADDVAIVGSDYPYSEGLRTWQLGVRSGYEGDVRLFVHTDRGVYRPKERVYVHGLVRSLSDLSGARVPADRAVHVVLEADSELIADRRLTLSDFGSFATEIDLPAHLQPGSYSLQVEAAGKSDSYPISVAEFKPMTFELSGQLDKTEVLGAVPVQLDIAARYLFGAPLAAASVNYTVERSPASFQPPGFDEFRFEDSAPALPSEEPLPESPEGVLLESEDQTDEQGRSTLSFEAEAVRHLTRYTVTAAVTDAAQDRATRSFSLLAHAADRYVGTHLARFVMSAGQPIDAQVVLVDRAGKPVAGNVEVELRQERWDCQDPMQSCHANVFVLATQVARVTADKPAQVTFPTGNLELITRGRVHVRVSARDAAGRIARASDSGYVWSQSGAEPYDDRVAATLSADRKHYAIGERASVALQTPLAPAQFLVTSERGDVLSASVQARSAGLPSLVLDAAAAPNVFVMVSGMTPRSEPGEVGRPRLVAGATELPVTGSSRALVAQIKLARDSYQPHERVEGDVTVTHLGKPVSAEVALAAVNESVLLLTDFETPDPTRVFHAPRGLGVSTFSNITRVVADPRLLAAVPETARVGMPGEDNTGGKPELRNDYVAAAFIAPQLRTDSQGKLHFAFEAPTDLSAYRLMAVVAAKDDRVGSADTRFRVSQPIAAHLVAPRFVSRGDGLEIGALVHDTTGTPGPTQVELRAEGLELARDRAEVVADATGALLRTHAEVTGAGSAYFEAELHKGAFADRVRHELLVRRPLDTELRVLASGRAPVTRARVDWPKGIDAAESRFEVTVDRAGLAGLGPVLAMVLNYPYGCTEQTSAALNAIAAAPELTRAIMPELANPKRLGARIEDGVGRLLAARSGDGQFGLYPGMSGRPWLTLLVLETGLALRGAGYNVPDALTSAPVQLIAASLAEQNIAKLSAVDLEEAAHAASVLSQAHAVQPALLDALLGQAARMSDDAQAYLLRALALEERPEPQRAPLRAALVRMDWLARKRDPELPFASAERSSALALAALSADGVAAREVDRLAQWLIERASDPEVYMSTRDVADALSALTSWAKRKQSGASKLRVTFAGQTLWQGALSGADVIALQRSASAAAGSGEVLVEADDAVSVSIRRRDVSETAPKPAFSRGLSLDRRYLEPGGTEPVEHLKLGDVLTVELSLHTERAVRMVALDDPLPAGLEPMDPGLASDRIAGCSSCEAQGNFDHLRRHDDRVEVFAEWLPAGTHVVRYQLRATTPGRFSAPGATATLMYMPDMHARSRVGALSVE